MGARRIHRSCSARSSRPLPRPQPRPRRARQPRLRALHLADPPLSRPDRPPGAALGARRRRGRARARRGARGRRVVLRARARVDEDRARRRRASAPSFLLERELFERGLATSFEGEVSGVIGAGAFVRFGGELADVYEGFLPARRMRGERFEINPTETALVGRRSGREIGIGDPIAVRVDRVEARARAGSTSCPRGEAGDEQAGQAQGRPRATWRPTGARSTATRSSSVRVRDRAAGHRGQVAARGQGQIGDAYAVIEEGEVWLRNAHIPPYAPASPRTTSPSGRASCCCTARRSSA